MQSEWKKKLNDLQVWIKLTKYVERQKWIRQSKTEVNKTQWDFYNK